MDWQPSIIAGLVLLICLILPSEMYLTDAWSLPVRDSASTPVGRQLNGKRSLRRSLFLAPQKIIYVYISLRCLLFFFRLSALYLFYFLGNVTSMARTKEKI